MSNVIELNIAEIETVVGGVSGQLATSSVPTTATATMVVRPATSSNLQVTNVDVAAFIAQNKRR